MENGGFAMFRFLPEGYLCKTEENKAFLSDIERLRTVVGSGKILEGIALCCDNAHNLIVDLGVVRGIIPRSEGAIGITDGSVRDIAMIARVNKPVCFCVTQLVSQQGKEVAILSRRLAQEACQHSYLDKLHAGDIIPARVTHLESFGCFVDIGCGISSLIPIDAASVSRIAHPRDRFRLGQDIYGVVKSVDSDGRISLTHKELLGSWEQNVARFSAGETVAGIIRSVEDYGIFVELTPNLAGLAERREGVRVGQQASVYIKSIIPEKMKIKLIIVDAFDADYCLPDYHYAQTSGHISTFRYSPPTCSRVMETVFTD